MPNNDKVKIFVNKSVAERVLKRLQESSPEVTWRGETDLRDVFMNVAQMENVTALKILWEEL